MAAPVPSASPAPVPVTLELPGGAHVVTTEWRPVEAAGTVLCLPALGVAASYYAPLASALAARGLTAVTADLRGLGGSSLRPDRRTNWGYARLVEDAAAMVATLRARGPGPVVLLGHSIGGHVGALLAGARPGAIDALALVACGTPYWRCFPGRAGPQVLALAWIARVSSAVVGYYPGERIGFAGREAAQLMSEWSALARRGRFEVAGLDAEGVLATARVPVLAVRIPGDDKAPAAALQHLTGKLAACEPTVVAIEPSRLDPRTHDHIRWVRDAAPVADVVARWVRAR